MALRDLVRLGPMAQAFEPVAASTSSANLRTPDLGADHGARDRRHIHRTPLRMTRNPASGGLIFAETRTFRPGLRLQIEAALDRRGFGRRLIRYSLDRGLGGEFRQPLRQVARSRAEGTGQRRNRGCAEVIGFRHPRARWMISD